MNTNKGFVQIILIIVIVLVALGYFGLNLREIIDSPAVSDNLSYFWNGVVYVWDHFLAGPVIYLWGILKNLLWGAFVNNIQSIIDRGQKTIIQNEVPYINVGTTTQ